MAAERGGAGQGAAYQVRVLDRAIDILDSFTRRQRELGIREIVEATGLNRSTAIRLVANLERRGLLQRATTPGRYRLGQRLFEMGSIVYSSFSLRAAAAEPLQGLEQRCGATILLAAPNGEYTVIVEKRQGVGDGFAMVPMPGDVGQVQTPDLRTHRPCADGDACSRGRRRPAGQIPSGAMHSLLHHRPRPLPRSASHHKERGIRLGRQRGGRRTHGGGCTHLRLRREHGRRPRRWASPRPARTTRPSWKRRYAT